MTEEEMKMLSDKNSKIEIANGETFVHNNGKTFKLNELPIDVSKQFMNINFCSFCGAPSGKDPLFTIDKKAFICKDCVILAYNTFLENNIPMPVNLKVTKSEKRQSK